MNYSKQSQKSIVYHLKLQQIHFKRTSSAIETGNPINSMFFAKNRVSLLELHELMSDFQEPLSFSFLEGEFLGKEMLETD